MATHPGPALLDILGTYRDAIRTGRAQQDALDTTRRVALASSFDCVRLVLESDLNELVAMHEGRGLMDGAAQWLGSMFRKGLTRRLQDPFFDLMAVFRRPHPPSIRALVEDYVCDALQERSVSKKKPDLIAPDDLFMRDDLVKFTEERDALGYTPSDYVRALQAQQHYLGEHIDWIGRTLRPSGGAETPCPYLTSCNLELRKERPDYCQVMPWAHYEGSNRLYWYGSGVAGTLGTVKLTKLASPP
jgi:hypothetical protein